MLPSGERIFVRIALPGVRARQPVILLTFSYGVRVGAAPH